MKNLAIEFFVALLIITIAFFAGRLTASKQVAETNTNTQVETEKKNHTVITIVKDKDGTTKTIKTIDSTVDTTKDIKTQVQTPVASISKPLNVSLLMAMDNGLFKPPTYGLSISKQVIGPITAGLFGFANGTLGLSIGINF